ncbi:Uncharacterised protein [uncultured Blautia sp.]|nr:Uncharacterised protein [uncultured Blautia sp.]
MKSCPRSFFCNRKDLVTLIRENSFLLQKRSAREAHAEIRECTARRCCGGQSGPAPSRIEGMGELKWACPLCAVIGKTLSR